MGLSRKEIQTSVLNTTRQSASQIGDLVNDFINITMNEINYPSWAFTKNVDHLWGFLRRKTTITTTSGTNEYVLGRGVDRVALMRQTSSPLKLLQIRDEEFFDLVPNPTDSGNPRYYRMWEVDGVSTRLAAADTIDVVSSSTSDAGSAELKVSVSGYVSSIWRTETYQLNGTTTVSGSLTFDINSPIIVSKQKDTTGVITVTENSGGTTLATLGPDERGPRYKVITLYPNPSSALTVYIEYYVFMPQLENDSDSPIFDENWHHVVRMGALSKVYQYLNKEVDFSITQNMYASMVRSMVTSDRSSPDLIEHLRPNKDRFPLIHQRRTEDAIA